MTPGCRASVNNGEMDAHKHEVAEKGRFTLFFFSFFLQELLCILNSNLFFLLAHAPLRDITAKTLIAEVGHCICLKEKD